MKYNPNIHNRQSIRLKGYDYSQTGLYFFTICVQNRECLFGKIEKTSQHDDSKMKLNDAGIMVEKWYYELENKYPNIKCREHMVMPNHFHCIIEITNAHDGTDAHVGTSLRGRPKNDGRPENDGRPKNDGRSKSPYGPDNKKYNASIFDIMGWFKTMTTNEYIRGVKNKKWQRFYKRLWQLRYWDHIIRNENNYFRISNYIINNPAKWEEDKFYSDTE